MMQLIEIVAQQLDQTRLHQGVREGLGSGRAEPALIEHGFKRASDKSVVVRLGAYRLDEPIERVEIVGKADLDPTAQHADFVFVSGEGIDIHEVVDPHVDDILGVVRPVHRFLASQRARQVLGQQDNAARRRHQRFVPVDAEVQCALEHIHDLQVGNRRDDKCRIPGDPAYREGLDADIHGIKDPLR